jgi:phage/plasmid-associated DNA primase
MSNLDGRLLLEECVGAWGVDAVLAWCRDAMSGHARRMLVIEGMPRSGKSVLASAIVNVLAGPASCVVTADQLFAIGYTSAMSKQQLDLIRGARVVMVSDFVQPRSRRRGCLKRGWQEACRDGIKKVLLGDQVSTRLLRRREIVKWTPRCSLIATTNELPTWMLTGSMLARLVRVPTSAAFYGREADRGLVVDAMAAFLSHEMSEASMGGS